MIWNVGDIYEFSVNVYCSAITFSTTGAVGTLLVGKPISSSVSSISISVESGYWRYSTNFVPISSITVSGFDHETGTLLIQVSGTNFVAGAVAMLDLRTITISFN